MDNENKKSFKEKIEEQINMQRRIPITFPNSVAISLIEYAKENCNDCYWLAFKQLLDFYNDNKDRDLTTKMLVERDDFNYKKLKDSLDMMESTLKGFLDGQEKKKKEKPSHFGE